MIKKKLKEVVINMAMERMFKRWELISGKKRVDMTTQDMEEQTAWLKGELAKLRRGEIPLYVRDLFHNAGVR